jgi:hypothetical protein
LSLTTLNAPLADALLTLSVASPVLVRDTACWPLVVPTSTLPKLALPKLTAGAGTFPVPLRAALSVVVSAKLATRVPEAAPPELGVKVTSTAHESPTSPDAASEHEPGDTPKSPEPVVERLTVPGEASELVTVKEWVLELPTLTVPNEPLPETVPAEAGTAGAPINSRPEDMTNRTRAKTRLIPRVFGCRAPRIGFRMFSDIRIIWDERGLTPGLGVGPGDIKLSVDSVRSKSRDPERRRECYCHDKGKPGS